MRQAIRDILNNAISLKYKLPDTIASINGFNLSTQNDYCFSVSSNEDLSKIIYNAVIDYAFHDFELEKHDFSALHRRALLSKLKYNQDATHKQKLKYGFYGEVILYCMLFKYFEAPTAIARGQLFNILENSETKGYDSYHLIEHNDSIEFWFGEVKFYQGSSGFKKATTGENGAVSNLMNTISDTYLNKNLIAISEVELYLSEKGKAIKPILQSIKDNPEIQIKELAKLHNMKLVYPIAIIFDETKEGFDQTIKEAISHINSETSDFNFTLSIDKSLFFILIPVNDTNAIKTKVIEWISTNEPLI